MLNKPIDPRILKIELEKLRDVIDEVAEQLSAIADTLDTQEEMSKSLFYYIVINYDHIKKARMNGLIQQDLTIVKDVRETADDCSLVLVDSQSIFALIEAPGHEALEQEEGILFSLTTGQSRTNSLIDFLTEYDLDILDEEPTDLRGDEILLIIKSKLNDTQGKVNNHVDNQVNDEQ